ncbi:bifunctional hydroxymethylpyrimidine kinase/phosphomethylpyrimidine kinase [Nocardioides speluncae]|uniref:bifunctional hydroxymethylpyrimidine kinase/phosphomethylpyrimidine kinase n=1 Tax=Nocardioides speluncae TaxID=2670337 RepID=UPI000D697EEE|nr:bifunctional hydroxymethylpyrimidine kinase/phosphomethylpyrimidine kinase [Nocardioides speluncae]
MTPPVVLTVAGTDSGGAAGIAADLATFAALDVHGACVVTAVTAQDTTGVHAVHLVPGEIVEAQLDAVFGDLPVAAVKTGMLGSADAVVGLSDRYRALSDPRPALVVDPVLVATSGAVLGDDLVAKAYVEYLMPLATVVTPNADEAAALTGTAAPPDELAHTLAELGCAVVVTGGVSTSSTTEGRTCTDWLALPGDTPIPLTHPAIETDNDHGTGCTFSAALAAHLAHGTPLRQAVAHAAAYTTQQLDLSRTWNLGRGRGPIAHTHDPFTQEASHDRP